MAGQIRLRLLASLCLGAAVLTAPASAERPSGRLFDMIDRLMQQIPGHRETGGQGNRDGNRQGQAAAPQQQLADVWNPQGCKFTDSSQFALSRPTLVDKIDLWYNWGSGERSTPFTLVGASGQIFARGELRRDSCDPYQGAWCVATASPRIVLPAGRYRVVAGRARVCQNAASGHSGFIRAWGSAAGAGASRTTGQDQSPASLGRRWNVYEEIPGGRHWQGYWTRRPGTNTFDARWRDSLTGLYVTDTLELTEARGGTVRLYRRGNNGTYTGRIAADGVSIRGSTSWYPPGAFWTARIEN